MKHSLVLILVVLLAVVAGCSRKEATPAPAAAQPPAAVPAAAVPPAATPAPAAVAQSVADIPDYPGAVRVAFSQGPDAERGFTRKSEADWTSTDPYATVVAYYQKAITDNGWTVTGSEVKGTETEWDLAKGTSVGKVEIKQKAGMPVTIEIERSDR